ncbi:Hypothetical predicted protein [Podarcis lilfordi]|uniref:Uncharacterized protein n=1 Tax=Podarcis lilfordi TaxID=74358 RepID=A0AA35JNZ4_9SAUR|nr:Hypothetical predicted protein [Podarcis lilfordi]
MLLLKEMGLYFLSSARDTRIQAVHGGSNCYLHSWRKVLQNYFCFFNNNYKE